MVRPTSWNCETTEVPFTLLLCTVFEKLLNRRDIFLENIETKGYIYWLAVHDMCPNLSFWIYNFFHQCFSVEKEHKFLIGSIISDESVPTPDSSHSSSWRIICSARDFFLSARKFDLLKLEKWLQSGFFFLFFRCIFIRIAAFFNLFSVFFGEKLDSEFKIRKTWIDQIYGFKNISLNDDHVAGGSCRIIFSCLLPIFHEGTYNLHNITLDTSV